VRRKCIRQGGAAAHALVHIFQDRSESGAGDAALQEIERLHQRHAGLKQRGEFLVEEEKILRRDLSALRQPQRGE